MADTIDRIIPSGTQTTANVPVAATTLYTVETNKKLIIRHMAFSNPTSAPITVWLWIHGSPYATERVIPPLSERPVDVSEIVVKANETIRTQASATGCFFYLHGVVESP